MSSLQERRRKRRYTVALPIEVVKLRSQIVELSGETCNVSSGGALFVIGGEQPPEGSQIEFRLKMRGAATLHCMGHVIRVEDTLGDQSCGVAASIDRYKFIRPAAQ